MVSHTPHYWKNGSIVGWGPTVRELDYLSRLFEKIIHIAPLHQKPVPESALHYRAGNIRLHPVDPAGGDRFVEKAKVSALIPQYLQAILSEMGRADVVHIRCPANISLIAISVLPFIRRIPYRWIKYAGNWQPRQAESWSYTFQRWWLKYAPHGGVVTINGSWPNQLKHIITFDNPSITDEELVHSEEIPQGKRFHSPYELLYVGRVEESKGVGRLLRIANQLSNQNIPFHLNIIGDGPDRDFYEQWVTENEFGGMITFHGWKAREQINRYYGRAHFFIFPSSASEGWPKVLSEAMTYGVVPIASSVSSIPQILNQAGAGEALPPNDVNAFVASIIAYINKPSDWLASSQAGRQAAQRFSYTIYLRAVKDLFQKQWGINLTRDQVN